MGVVRWRKTQDGQLVRQNIKKKNMFQPITDKVVGEGRADGYVLLFTRTTNRWDNPARPHSAPLNQSHGIVHECQMEEDENQKSGW